MSDFSQTLAANTSIVAFEHGAFFRLFSSTGAVNVKFFRNNAEILHVDSVLGGFWRRGEFDKVEVTDISGANNTVAFVIDTGEIGYDQSAGQVSVSSLPPVANPVTQSNTVTGADAQILAANTSRKFLMLQNTGTADVFVTFDGSAATANGAKIAAGGAMLFDVFVPNGAIRAYSATASALVAVEG